MSTARTARELLEIDTERIGEIVSCEVLVSLEFIEVGRTLSDDLTLIRQHIVFWRLLTSASLSCHT